MEPQLFFSAKKNSNELSLLLFYTEHKQVSAIYRGLSSAGYRVLAQEEMNNKILNSVMQHAPDMVVLCVNSLKENVIDALKDLNRYHPLPVTIFAEKDEPKNVVKAIKSGVSAYVTDELQLSRIPSIVNVSMARFSETKRLIDELAETKSKLVGRKVVERAKGLLMSYHGITEEGAYKRLRKMSMDKGVRIEVVARNVLDVISLIDSNTKS